MKRSNARSHYVEVVLPAFQEFAESYSTRVMGFRKDTRLAGIAAGAMRDVPEHVVPHLREQGYVGQGAGKLRNQLCSASRAYEITCNLGDCWKHRALDKKTVLLRSLEDVQECVAITRYDDSQGPYYMARKLIQLGLSDGTFADAGRALVHAFYFISQALLQLRVIPSMPALPPLLPARPNRGDERYENPMEVSGEAGEAFSCAFKFFVFRDGSDLAEPTETQRFGTYDIKSAIRIRPSQFPE